MIVYLLSVIGMAAVLSFALSNSSHLIFLNLHSILLVVGGTACVFGLATPAQDIKSFFKSILRLFERELSVERINEHLLMITKQRESTVTFRSHPLIAYAQSLWEQGVEPDMFSILLNQRVEEMVHASEQSIITTRNLAKYPPALGMTGTVIGLVALFANLTPGSQANIGTSLAMAMTATFYGLVLSNAFLMPLADRLYVRHLSHTKVDDHVFRSLMLIHRGTTQSILEEKFRGAA